MAANQDILDALGVESLPLDIPDGYDHVGAIMDFETGNLNDGVGVITLFQYLLDTGMCWNLQGSYGRTAQAMLDNGLIERRS